ncbi:cAMP-binding domain of CRP or a regulatory subunit of cAMP-dependent protein kinases [Chitinophaga sp. YR573]|uniref:Crp/Fnr family transcriptional regulator n=1 Tax=Chitinophaga sp. YR573 TaxID=1881040 RepID=UPI0008B4FF19|nr:Crp/Fnr family transcriptional regulator [Chitinophaga sp. YR573]SEW45629.1 cAMP-binding domain of CRP or a regulatory subunit of cAMP-dependent protein kinases [Chitinophaga sp. YR573]
MEALKTHIRNTISIQEDELAEITDAFQSQTVSRDSFVLKAGQFCDAYYFVETGAFRIFTNLDEKDITSWFAFEGYFFTEPESYAKLCRSRFNIQAIEESVIYLISRKKMDELLSKSLNWNEFIRKSWEQAFIKLQDVVLSFQAQSAGERYENLFNYPDFLQKARQQDLASMLGVTRFSLSRLRGKK